MKTASVLLNVFNVLVLGASIISLLPNAMIFDEPGSQKRKSLWFLFWVFMLFPVVAAGSLFMGWKKWYEADYDAALKAGGVAPAYGVFAAICLLSILRK